MLLSDFSLNDYKRCVSCKKFKVITLFLVESGKEDPLIKHNCLNCRKDSKKLSVKSVYKSYQKGAEERHLEFDISITEFAKLIVQPCLYCGSKPNVRNGLDRVDNTCGYYIDNVVPCCWRCNSAKGSMSLKDFLSFIEAVYNNIIK